MLETNPSGTFFDVTNIDNFALKKHCIKEAWINTIY